MRRKTLLNRNVIIVLMLFIFLMTAFVSTAYSFWYFPNESLKTVNTDMKVDDIEENFKNTGSYLKIIDCRDGVIPNYTDFAIQSESGFLDNSENFTEDGNIFKGKNGNYSKKVFGVSSSNVNVSYRYPFKGEYALKSFVSSVFYQSGTSLPGSGTSATDMTEIYLYDLLNSKYKLVDHLTNENIELRNKNGTSSDGGDMDKPLDAKLYSSTKFEDYRKNIGYSFSKSKILFLVPRNTEILPKVGDYNIYYNGYDYYSNLKRNLDYVWLWNDRTDFGVSLSLTDCSVTKDGTNYNKSVHINYETLYHQVCNDFNDTTKKSGFIMTPQTTPTGIVFKTENGTDFAPKDKHGKIEYLALPLPPKDSTSFDIFDIYITVDKTNGKFTISTNQDVDLTKNKNIVYYSTSGLDHLWMWSSSTSGVDRWISSNYVYKFKMAGFDKPVSCFSYNYGEKFNFYKNWKGPDGTMPDGTPAKLSPGFTFDKNEEGEKIDYNYDRLVLVDYNNADNGKTEDIDISGLFNGTSECTSIYLLEENKVVTKCTTSKDEFIKALKDLEKSEPGSK